GDQIPITIREDVVQGVYVDANGIYTSVNSFPRLIAKYRHEGGEPTWERRYSGGSEIEDLDWSNGDLVSFLNEVRSMKPGAGRPLVESSGVNLNNRGYYKTSWEFGRDGTVIFYAKPNSTGTQADPNYLMVGGARGSQNWR